MVKEEMTVSELAAEYGVHPTQLHRWKSHIIANLPLLFERTDNVTALKADYDNLYTEIGRLTTKLAWLEKRCQS